MVAFARSGHSFCIACTIKLIGERPNVYLVRHRRVFVRTWSEEYNLLGGMRLGSLAGV